MKFYAAGGVFAVQQFMLRQHTRELVRGRFVAVKQGAGA